MAVAQTEPTPIVVDYVGAAEHLVRIGVVGASVWTVRGLVAKKRLTPVPIGKKDWFRIADLEALFARKR